MSASDQTSAIVKAQKQLMDTRFMQRIKVDIYDLFKNRMKEGIHWMKIPGEEKPFLKKEGVELLAQYYTIRPSYEITIDRLQDDHREYHVKCRIYKMTLPGEEPILIGEGDASASTMESNHRFRNIFKDSGRAVPKEYWELRKKDDAESIKKIKTLLGPNGYARKNESGSWTICLKEKVMNDEVPNSWNPCKKTACTRAFRTAVVTVLAAGDFFVVSELPTAPNNLKAEDADFKEVGDDELISLNLSPEDLTNPGKIIKCYENIQSINELNMFDEEYSLDLKMFSGNDEALIKKARTEAVRRLSNGNH